MDLARTSEVLVVCSRATAENRGLISRAVIEAVGPEGLIVNVARGSLVDEDALIAALKDGRLGRAALDVFWEEPTPATRWADVPNVVLTPHGAGGTADSIPRMVGQAIDNMRRFLAGQPVASPVAA
jgi:lactate dehydrogenase-like 2-hydroxyacid dehydrogenase